MINNKIVLIGGSAGSLNVVVQILRNLKINFNFPIIVVFHRKYIVEHIIENILQTKTGHSVIEANDKDLLHAGKIYLAPPDYHLLVEKNHSLSLDFSEKVNYSRPSIDVTFLSALDIFKKNTIGVILSGANADGVEAMKQIQNSGGLCIVQNPNTAEFDFMPNQVINAINPDYIANPVEIAEIINSLS